VDYKSDVHEAVANDSVGNEGDEEQDEARTHNAVSGVTHD
jgi:hypothetical protein